MKKKIFSLQTKKLNKVRSQVRDLFAPIYDPFHDVYHAYEVEKTAHHIVSFVKRSTKNDVPSEEAVRLLSLLHDTSRKIIGVNFLLEPLMGGYISGHIGYNIMRESGYSHEKSVYIRSIIRNHESFLGLWNYPMDINGKIFADADNVEGYSHKRLERAIVYFEQKKFSNILLNMYIYGLVYVHTFVRPSFYFEESKKLQQEYIGKLRFFMKKKGRKLEYMLYGHVYRSFAGLDIFR